MLNPQFHTILYRALLIILLRCYKLFISYSYFQKNKNVALSWPRTRGQQIVGGRLNRLRHGIMCRNVICIYIISTGISRNALCSRVPEKLAGYKICAGYFSPNMEKTSPGFLEIPEYLGISGKRGVPNWERASWKIKHDNNEPSR